MSESDQKARDSGQPPVSSEDDPADGGFVPSRRAVLMLGAAAASTVVTIRPALAQTAGSVLNCEIQVPGPQAAGSYVAPDGRLVAAGTPGAAPPLARPLTGEQARVLLRGSTPPGVNPQSAQAYANYIRRLQAGMSGFTCYASLQMPR
ncbi:hypothetical protein RCO27_16250 [Sphingosinicella sp. LHD-64]|uniref:hypothetical protein n=1 Tax=Sphingosinicella sp. LHD-64 TaxID=3072139 RepID=UPI00280F3061|nr:hypothetical protein [Sphingosinicella sp. LHD-64]MDQ8757779.1 hypothetical protein [Sphingosinicella sp. LHD-64]